MFFQSNWFTWERKKNLLKNSSMPFLFTLSSCKPKLKFIQIEHALNKVINFISQEQAIKKV